MEMTMELTIVHLFPDFMSLYGEYANLTVLCRHLERLGVSPAVRAVTAEELAAGGALEGADMLYMGAGTERGQKRAMESLVAVRAELAAAVERGALVLFTGNAMETPTQQERSGLAWPWRTTPPWRQSGGRLWTWWRSRRSGRPRRWVL